MASTVTTPIHAVPIRWHGDAFHDPGIGLVIIALTLLAVGSLLALVCIDYGDDVAVPAWDEHAVPTVTTT